MQDCPECSAPKLRKISHFSKEFRCDSCRSEFEVSKGVGTFIQIIISMAFAIGIPLALVKQSWFIFIIVCILIPYGFYFLLRKNTKLKLVGLRAKLKEKGL